MVEQGREGGGGLFCEMLLLSGSCQTFSFILLSRGVTLCVFGLQMTRGNSERENVFTHGHCRSAGGPDSDLHTFEASLKIHS